MRKAITLSLSLVILATSVAVFADARVGGGEWDYGVGPLGSRSNYLHLSKYHTSSVTKSGHDKAWDDACPEDWSCARMTGVYSGCEFWWNVP